jgi:pimeloyl-ACP methyl ester carboxylesterase
MTQRNLPPRAANVAVQDLGEGARREPVDLVAADRAPSSGLYYAPDRPDRPRIGIHLMHPRTDQTRNYNIGPLIKAGFAVLARNSRSVNNDIETLHEDLLLDMAAGIAHLRDRGCETVILLGNSGGAALAALYQSQAEAEPSSRIAKTDTLSKVDLQAAQLPSADAFVSVGGHAGQGRSLLKLIDASIVDEGDPVSIDPQLDIYDPANGFRLPVRETHYAPEFVAAVRAGQRRRVERLDRLARAAIASEADAQSLARSLVAEDVPYRLRLSAERRGAARRSMTVYRTVADPALLDTSIEPDDRVAGGFDAHPRPDIQNYAQVGFAHHISPRAWLSTWSGLSSHATTATCIRNVRVPTLIVHYNADIFTRRSELAEIEASSAAGDKTTIVVHKADHYGRAITPEGSLGTRVPDGPQAVVRWIADRFSP